MLKTDVNRYMYVQLYVYMLSRNMGDINVVFVIFFFFFFLSSPLGVAIDVSTLFQISDTDGHGYIRVNSQQVCV